MRVARAMLAQPRRRLGTLASSGVVVALVGSLTVLLLTTGGVYSTLSARAFNASPQTITSGSLTLTLTNNGVGFSSGISGLAQGNTVNRYVTLTNGGSLAGATLTFTAAVGASTTLSTDATNGLQAKLDHCDVAWTPTPSPGSCGGTTTPLMALTSLSALIAAPVALTGFSAVPAGQVVNVRLAVSLPATNVETATNGVLSSPTIQGLSSAVTWTFTEAQRTATTTNS